MKPYNLLLLITLLLSAGNISAQSNKSCSHKAFLGVNYQTISKEAVNEYGLDNTHGLYVTSVIEGTAASKYGILPLDYIYGIDEYRVGRKQSLGSILNKFESGNDVKLHFYRKGKKKKINFVLGSKNDKYKDCSSKKNHKGEAFFGISPKNAPNRGNGISVNITRNSTASEMGMKNGDIISEINGYDIFSWTEVSGTINMLEPGDDIAVVFIRDGKEYSKSLPIKSSRETKGQSSCDNNNSNSYYFDWDKDGGFNVNVNVGKDESYTATNEDLDDFRDGAQVDMSRVDISVQDNPSSIPSNIRTKGDANANVRNIQLHAQENGRFNLKFNATRSDHIQVRVYNEAGRQLYLYDLSEFDGLFEDEINLSQNGTGNYFLYVQQGNSYALKQLQLK